MTDANYTPEFDPADVDGDYGSTGGDITVPTFHDIKPFRFWCQKALPLVYDDSLSYYEVLCKVVNYLNNMMTDLTTGTGAITQFANQFVINQQFLNDMAEQLGQNTEELEDYINDRMGDFTDAYNELQDYVNEYFNNLDVQDEIDAKLDEMAEGGQFNVLFDPVIQAWMEDETEYINTSITNQNGTLAQQNGRISVLEGRMDTFASLPSGSTSGNAELLDIRTNFLGETFGSAGDAVRTSDFLASGFSSQPFVEEVLTIDVSSFGFFDVSAYKGGKYAIILNSFIDSLTETGQLYINSSPSTDGATRLYDDNDETSGHEHVSDYINDYIETITETYTDGYRILVTFSIPSDATFNYIGLKYYKNITGAIEPNYIGYATNWISIPVDPTLSHAGESADAKATGDALSELNERLTNEISDVMGELGETTNNGSTPAEKTVTWQNGYVNTSGVVTTSTVSGYALVPLSKGETVIIGTNNPYISIISSTTADSVEIGDTVTMIQSTGAGEVFKTFRYTATEDIKLVLCVRLSEYKLNFYAPSSAMVNMQNSFNADIAKLSTDIGTVVCPNIMGGDVHVYYPVNIPAGSKFTVSTSDGSVYPGNQLFVELYDSNKNRIDRFLFYTSTRTITTNPSDPDIAYLAWNIIPSMPIMVNYGDTALPYTEYVYPVRELIRENKEKINTVVCPNLMGSDPNVYYPVNIPAGTAFAISTSDGSIFPEEGNLQINLYDATKTRTDYFILRTGTPNRVIVTNSSRADTAYLKWTSVPSVPLMVNYGNTVLPYTEYFEPVVDAIAKIRKRVEIIPASKSIVDALDHRVTVNTWPAKNTLTMLWVTDIHSEVTRTKRMVDILNSWSNTFDIAINTGDTVYDNLDDGITWYDNIVNDSSIPILNTVGNHDAWLALDTVPPTLADQIDVYNAIIAPVAQKTEIVQPTDAATNGLCYYYKDINGIRLIVLDCMYWNNDELTWFTNALADAKTAGKPVIACVHCPFNSSYRTLVDTIWNKGIPNTSALTTPIDAANAVNSFIESGGKFICWLQGHSHADRIAKLTGYGNQLCLQVTSFTNRETLVYKNPIETEYNYDALTAISVDLNDKLLKIYRIGANVNNIGQKYNCFVYNFDTQEMITDW